MKSGWCRSLLMVPVLAGVVAGAPVFAQENEQDQLSVADRFDLLGVQYMEEKSYPEAVTSVRQALAADSTMTLAWLHLALAYTEMGRAEGEYFKEAATVYKRLAETLPPNDVAMLRGRAYLRALSGDYNGSVEDYRLILAEQPTDCDALAKLFQVRSTQSEVVIEAIGAGTEEVQQYANDMADAQLQLLELCPEMVTDYETLFYTFTRSRRFEEGAATFADLMEYNPDDVELIRYTGDLYYMGRNWEASIPLYEKLLEAQPGNQEYRLKYIAALRKLERFEEADRELQEYIRIRNAEADSPGR